VNWSYTTRNTKTKEAKGPVDYWEEVSQVTINPQTCEMRVAWNSSGGESRHTYFLEEMDHPEVLSTEQLMNRSNPAIQYTLSTTPYSILVNPNATFEVRDQQTANQIAGAFRQLAQQCTVTPPPAANSKPSLEDTLSFIADKLDGQGAASWSATVQNNTAGASGSPTPMTFQIPMATGDPHACRLVYHQKISAGAKVLSDLDLQLNFRRVEKLAVMPLQDANNDSHSRQGHAELVESISPAVSALVVTGAGGRTWYFAFADQELANRVAKAMNHAGELCGAGGQEVF
jgi:hypothetical protein